MLCKTLVGSKVGTWRKNTARGGKMKEKKKGENCLLNKVTAKGSMNFKGEVDEKMSLLLGLPTQHSSG